jgi:hypothetical protein
MLKNLFAYSFLLLVFVPLQSYAQMFSVGNKVERRINPFTPYLRAGVQIIDFKYTGNPTALANSQPLSFTGLGATAQFETAGFTLGATYGNDFTGLSDRNYFSLGLSFSNAFYIVRKPHFGIGIPIHLGTNLTNVRSDTYNDQFSQTNLSAGAGAITRVIYPKHFDFSAQFIPKFGFSTASGGFIGGNVFSLLGKARFNFYNLIFSKNISLGYNFMYNSYNIDGEEYDYDFNGHTITIGISL